MWFMYTMEYYTAEKNNDIMKFADKWMELENVILNEVTQTQKDKHGKKDGTNSSDILSIVHSLGCILEASIALENLVRVMETHKSYLKPSYCHIIIKGNVPANIQLIHGVNIAEFEKILENNCFQMKDVIIIKNIIDGTHMTGNENINKGKEKIKMYNSSFILCDFPLIPYPYYRFPPPPASPTPFPNPPLIPFLSKASTQFLKPNNSTTHNGLGITT
ncbi:hypothetical protein STEG23_025757 [Scotinomys teguina]